MMFPDGRWLLLVLAGLLGGILTLATPRLLYAESDGALDRSLKLGAGASDDVFAVAAMPDGDLVLGGYFTTYDGTERWRLARIHADGALDAAFDPGGSSGSSPVTQLAVLPDGKLLVAGSFSRFGGFERSLLVRLNPDGKVDAKFNATAAFRGITGRVNALTVQPDGKLLVGGRFDLTAESRGHSAALLVRLLPDGKPDESFACELLPDGREDFLRTLLVLPDGKLLVGSQTGVARLKPDGSRDDTFQPPTKLLGAVTALGHQSGSRLVVASQKESGWQVVRLGADGRRDDAFHTLAATGEDAGGVTVLAVQPDGKILMGGSFREVDGTRRHGLARLNEDGTLDKSFDPGTGVEVIPFEEADETPEAAVRVLLPLKESKWLVAGRFDLYNGMTSHNLARIFNAENAPALVAPAK